jgi:hypothetical protein
MRFMLLMLPAGYESAGPDLDLPVDRVEAMMAYNQALQDAGVLQALEGLHPPSTGRRVSFATGKPVVTDGPFAEAGEVLGGRFRAGGAGHRRDLRRPRLQRLDAVRPRQAGPCCERQGCARKPPSPGAGFATTRSGHNAMNDRKP